MKWSWKPRGKAFIIIGIFYLLFIPGLLHVSGINLTSIISVIAAGVFAAYLWWLAWQLLRNLVYRIEGVGMGIIVSITILIFGGFLVLSGVLGLGYVGRFLIAYDILLYIVVILSGSYLIIIGINRIRKSWMQRKLRE